MPLHAGGMIPGDDLLPDDWDKDLLEGIAPTGAPARAPAAPPLAAGCRLHRPHRHRRPGRLPRHRAPAPEPDSGVAVP